MLPGRLLLAALMLLTLPEIPQLLQSPRNGAAISACVAHEQRIRLHAEAQVVPGLTTPGMTQLLALPKAVLPDEKFQKFCAFIPSPLPTVQLTEKVFDGLSRVFEAQDGSVTVELATPELESDFETYRDAAKEQDFWPGTAFKTLGRAPHSVLVVDMPSEQRTLRPEPIVYLLDMSDVVDVMLKADSTCEYLAFRLPSRTEADGTTIIERVAVYDDGYYRVFEKPTGTAEWPSTPVLENAHILGTCPARMLWSEPLGAETGLLRKGPLTNQLGNLDRYVYWDACIEYFKTYGMFPPLWSVEEQCQYEGPAGETCHGGFVRVQTGFISETPDGPAVPRFRMEECPACKKNKYLGPGTHVVVPAPTKDTGDTRKPLGFVTVDVAALKDARESLHAQRVDILVGCLGTDGEAGTDAPMNEKQVRAGFESQQDVLARVGKNLAKARTWVLSTWGTLRYGSSFRRSVVNAGEQYYLKTPEQLSEAEIVARKAGRPVFELSQAREMRYFTQYRNNPPLLDRMRILSDLEPWPEYSLDQLTTMIAGAAGMGSNYLLSIYDPQRLALKADFARFITRFESEQADVRLFAQLQPYHLKLSLITSILLSYVPASSTAAGGFAMGESVMVRPGMAHMPQHEGLMLTVAQVQGDAYAVKLPDGSVHKWYTSAELMAMSSAPKPAPMGM